MTPNNNFVNGMLDTKGAKRKQCRRDETSLASRV